MNQISVAEAEFGLQKRGTRREKFLTGMEQVVPWSRLLAVVEPCYPTGADDLCARYRPDGPPGRLLSIRTMNTQNFYRGCRTSGLASCSSGGHSQRTRDRRSAGEKARTGGVDEEGDAFGRHRRAHPCRP